MQQKLLRKLTKHSLAWTIQKSVEYMIRQVQRILTNNVTSSTSTIMRKTTSIQTTSSVCSLEAVSLKTTTGDTYTEDPNNNKGDKMEMQILILLQHYWHSSYHCCLYYWSVAVQHCLGVEVILNRVHLITNTQCSRVTSIRYKWHLTEWRLLTM
jgi:hypothetical protein